MLKSALALALLLLATLVLVSCSAGGSPRPITEEHFFENFQTAVGSADKNGYTLYWLGRGFSAAGLEFQGPHVSDLPGDTVEGGGVHVTYGAYTTDGAQFVVDLTIYSPLAREKNRRRIELPAARSVTIAGHDAKLSPPPAVPLVVLVVPLAPRQMTTPAARLPTRSNSTQPAMTTGFMTPF